MGADLPVISPGREAWYRSRGLDVSTPFKGSTRFPDSISKLVFHLACLAPEQEVTYNGKKVVPSPVTRVTIGPSVFRRFVCADGCTSCCLPFTIDYTPKEFSLLPEELQDRVPWTVREVNVSGKRRPVITFNQAVFETCPYLTAELPHGGIGCSLWPKSPIECAAAPQMTLRWQKPGQGSISKRPFGRGWMFVPPAQCDFMQEDDEVALRLILQKDAMLLDRYQHWAEYLGIATVLLQAIEVLRSFRRREVPIPRKDAGSIVLYP